MLRSLCPNEFKTLQTACFGEQFADLVDVFSEGNRVRGFRKRHELVVHRKRHELVVQPVV